MVVVELVVVVDLAASVTSKPTNGWGAGGGAGAWRLSHSAAPTVWALHFTSVAPSSKALHCWLRAQGLPRWTGVQRPRARRCTVECGAVVSGATQKG